MAVKNEWVQIHLIVLKPAERAENIPDDTRMLPLEQWVKGNLVEESAALGDTVTVVTRTGRIVTGTLCAEQPCYEHSFGKYIPELHAVDDMVKEIVFGGQRNA